MKGNEWHVVIDLMMRSWIVKQGGPPRGQDVINQSETEDEKAMKASRAPENGGGGGGGRGGTAGDDGPVDRRRDDSRSRWRHQSAVTISRRASGHHLHLEHAIKWTGRNW